MSGLFYLIRFGWFVKTGTMAERLSSCQDYGCHLFLGVPTTSLQSFAFTFGLLRKAGCRRAFRYNLFSSPHNLVANFIRHRWRRKKDFCCNRSRGPNPNYWLRLDVSSGMFFQPQASTNSVCLCEQFSLFPQKILEFLLQIQKRKLLHQTFNLLRINL